jgi:ComF family protein
MQEEVTQQQQQALQEPALQEPGMRPRPLQQQQCQAASLAAWLRARSRSLPLRWRLLQGLLPVRCLMCGESGDLGHVDLCSHCLEALPLRPAAAVAGIAAGTGRCVPFAYAPPVDAQILALKFHGDLRGARVHGALLAAARATLVVPPPALPVALVPVPLHAERRRERGFNQAEQLARHAGRWLGVAVRCDVLRRVRGTVAQSTLPAAQRQRNVEAAFAAAPGAAALGHVALVDDVLTTGATLRAAALALRVAGVAQVECWAVAAAGLTPTSENLTDPGLRRSASPEAVGSVRTSA